MLKYFYTIYVGDFMERFISFILAVALCFGMSACGNIETPIVEAEERPLTVDELVEFAMMYDSYTNRILICTDSYSTAFVRFLRSLSVFDQDICHPLTDEEKGVYGEYVDYWRYEKDVMAIWNEYVDKDSPIATSVNNKDNTFYDSVQKKYYFRKNPFAYDFEMYDGTIKGNEATLYTSNSVITLKKSKGKWKLFSYTMNGIDNFSICDRMTRLTGDELEELHRQIKDPTDPWYGEWFDGYKSDDWYIIYEEWKMYYIKYEDGEYNTFLETGLDGRRNKTPEENIYVAEGRLTEMQYVVNPECLPKDETKGKKYNEAIDAYNNFIAKEATDRLESLNSENTNQTHLSSEIIDLDKDGVPEIVTSFVPMWPDFVFTYRNGKVVELPGAFSNGQHGGCGLLENGMYRSQHHSTGWTDTFVTYNKNGSQTIESFSEYYTYGYEKYTVKADGTQTDKYSIEFEKDEDGKRKFYALYSPYEEALEHFYRPDQWYSPFVADTTLNYSPYIMQQIKKYYK